MTLQIDVDPQLEARIAAAAQRQCVDKAELIKQVLQTYLPATGPGDEINKFSGKSVGDLIREIGFVDGLPSDLSTNPKYLEGFGELKHR